MTMTLRKMMLVLSMTLMAMQILLPIGMVYAETIVNPEDQEQAPLPSMKNYLNEEKDSTPRFFFTHSQMQGNVGEAIRVLFFSDQEVSEARVTMPKEAKLVKEQLPAGIIVVQETQTQWLVKAERPQNTFTLPVAFDLAGSYQVTVATVTYTIEIQDKEIMKEIPTEVTESSDESTASQEKAPAAENEDESVAEAEKQNEPVEEKPNTHSDNEQPASKSKTEERASFSGETAEVSTMAEFRAAVTNPDVSIISVQANLTESSANIMTVERPLLIQGNGHTLTFGNNGFYFQLANRSEAATFRIEDATITKVGTTPLVNSSPEESQNWTFELEDIAEVNANTMRLASLPEGKVVFTGGNTDFTRTNSTTTFIEAKEIVALNQAQVTINRGNATIFFSAATVTAPKLTVENDASLLITTAGGTANTIDFRGENPEIALQSEAQLTISTVGTTATPTNTTNNTVALTGVAPKISLNEKSLLRLTSTLAKRGLHLVGADAQVSVKDSELVVTSATQATVNLSGNQPIFSAKNSTIELTSTTGQRVNLVGETPQLNLSNTQLKLNATTGRGLFLQGATPQIDLDDSQLVVGDTGASQGIILQGTDAFLALRNHSELALSGAGTGTTENIQIGNNNARPQLLVTNGSKLSVTTTSGTGGASDTANNAIHLRGAEPKASITNESQLTVSVTSNARRGLYLNGAGGELTIKDSQLDISTISGQGVNLNGNNPIFLAEEAKTTIRSTSGQRMNLTGSNPKITLSKSQLSMNAATGRGIYLQGTAPQVLLDDSQLNMEDTGAAQGMILQGEDAFLSLSNQSEFSLSGAGTGTLQNIAVGNNNARPELLVTGGSKLSVTTTSGTGGASDTANNAVHLRGSNPVLRILDRSQVSVRIQSGARRAFFMNGNTGNFQIENSELDINAVSGQGISFSGSNSLLAIKDGSRVSSQTGVNDSIILLGTEPTLDISGENTKVDVSSNANSSSQHAASIFMGNRSNNSSSNARVLVQDGAELNVLAGDNSPAVGLRSMGGQFVVKENAKVNLKNGNASSAYEAAAATLRFIQAGSYSFLIDNAEMNITKDGGRAPGVRMHGSNNSITVRNKGIIKIDNPGNGSANNGGTALGNQAIHYTVGSNNTFTIQDPGSQVTLNADSGPGLDMETTGAINVIDGGYFSVSGRTSSSSGGVFNTQVVQITFDNPLFMDFRNNRPGGGNIFNVSNGSILRATNSDLAVWRHGSDLDADPDLNFRKLDYTFGGSNFNTLRETSDPEQLNTATFGNSGMTLYSRMSSNNGRWAIADELRVPTNADQKVYGHVSVPVGLNEKRSAWTDEATVTVEVISENGVKQEYQAKTVGHSEEAPGISIYGEEPRSGLFEIQLEEPLKAGEILRISEVKLSSGELTSGFENLILTDPVEVFPIVPPKPAEFSSATINQYQTSIQGHSENKDVKVTATHNGTWLDTENVEVDSNGNFVLDISALTLEEGDEIQVFLRDNEGSAAAAGVMNPPETNNEQGNINPAEPLSYHDTTFEAATVLTVADLSPVSPVDPLNPEVEVDPENKPEIPEDQGLLSIDFVSQFDFGSQGISVMEKTYYANPQRLLNEDGLVDERERPNYVQISDRRSDDERSGWQLAVTQKEQFKGENNQELIGAQLRLKNQQLVTAQGGTSPSLQSSQSDLVPGVRQVLLNAQDQAGTGTWVYRFGDEKTAKESIGLHVPQGFTPEATSYSTTIIWELSSVPDN
ncbi:WxL domain-containing protein [Enterococcus sp.]|uniref:WxL domain-containing protein n=1 Tax=Enterococcus sp. TaxID=35783 RepID=UPI0025C5C42A|nr:WxL domain-containing protein [Enterococcus sp.]